MSEPFALQIPYAPQFETIDLGALGPDCAGITARVLVNPTVGLRREFLRACYARESVIAEDSPWLRCVAALLGTQTFEETRATIDALPLDAMRWLFLPTITEDAEVLGKINVVQPYVVQLWDERTEKRVKAFASRSGGQA